MNLKRTQEKNYVAYKKTSILLVVSTISISIQIRRNLSHEKLRYFFQMEANYPKNVIFFNLKHVDEVINK